MSKQPVCEVCFFSNNSSLKTTRIIICKSCKRVAHQFCYLPEAQNEYFQCDMCTDKAKNPICLICHNPGLLKKTEEGEYAHPVCLIFCKEALVKSYKQLSFHFLRSKRKSKSAKCDICSKSSFLSDLFECFDRHCTKSAHYYCILKEQWKDAQQTGKWVQELKIFSNLNFNFLEYFYNKFKKYVKLWSNVAYREIFGESKVVEESPVFITYCRTHCQNLTNCYCVALEDPNSKIDWIFCDVCGKWYHFQCEQIEDSNIDGDYTCTCCRDWKKKLAAQQDPVLINFPRLHFYDVVYIQFYSELSNYQVSKSMKDLLKRVPFTCSIKNFTENFKSRDMLNRILKKTNFMCLKKIVFDNSRNNKELTANLQKNDKDLISIVWKLDFIASAQPIRAISGIKNRKYKVEEILSILQKYEKKHSEGSNILKPVIKQLLKLKPGVKSEEEHQDDSDDDQIIQEDIGQISEILRGQMEKLKKSNVNIQKCNESLTELYMKINQNEFFKEVLKDYIKQNRPNCQIFTPVFTYQSGVDMMMQTRMSVLFSKLDYFADSQNMQTLMVKYLSNIFFTSSLKVQTENVRIIRIIQSYDLEDENKFHLLNLNQVNQCVGKILELNSRKESYTMRQIQNNLDRFLQIKYLDNFFSHLHMRASSLAKVYKIYPKIREYVKQLGKEPLFESFLKLYENGKKLIEGIYEATFIQQDKLDVDLLQIIKNTRIDRSNIYRFCTFFIQMCKYSLSGLNPFAERTFIEKSQQYLNLISARSMVFQCQIEFKAASILLKKYPFSKPKVQEIVSRNKQLQSILVGVTLNSLSDLSFIGSNIQKLKEAKEFCEENNLQFRINKIEYMMKLYQCKEQSFRYFPAHFIVKQGENIPKKYSSIKCPTSVDFYVLKKYIYKMKMLKYPQTDYLFMKLSAVHQQKEEYFNTLSLIISNYNLLLTNQQVSKVDSSFTKGELVALIKSKRNDIVTCFPEEDEIEIICELYEELLQKMERKMKCNCVDIIELTSLLKQFQKFPFQPQPNGTYTNFCSYLKSISLRTEKSLHSEQERSIRMRKNELDQTSARGSQCQKSIHSMMENLKKQIISNPRTFTLKQIEEKSHELKFEPESEGLKQMIVRCSSILKENSGLINKFISNQAYTREDIIAVKKMGVQYGNQCVRVEVIENILDQLKIFEKAIIFGECQQSNRMLEKLSQPFYRAFYNKNIQNSRQPGLGQTDPKNEVKSKKTKIILKK